MGRLDNGRNGDGVTAEQEQKIVHHLYPRSAALQNVNRERFAEAVQWGRAVLFDPKGGGMADVIKLFDTEFLELSQDARDDIVDHLQEVQNERGAMARWKTLYDASCNNRKKANSLLTSPVCEPLSIQQPTIARSSSMSSRESPLSQACQPPFQEPVLQRVSRRLSIMWRGSRQPEPIELSSSPQISHSPLTSGSELQGGIILKLNLPRISESSSCEASSAS